jgi:hypothetical protein
MVLPAALIGPDTRMGASAMERTPFQSAGRGGSQLSPSGLCGHRPCPGGGD